MDPTAQRQNGREKVIFSLNAAIDTLNLVKEVSTITPAKAVFGSVGVILTMIKVIFFLRCDCGLTETIQDSMANEADCVELGLACVDVCTALDRGLNG